MTTTPATPDLRPVLEQALDQVGTLLDGLAPEDATRPTPCTDFDVAGLVGHLQAVLRRLTAVLNGEHFSVVPHQLDSTNWSGDWSTGRAALAPILADDCLTRSVLVPWGEATGAQALGMYVGELTVHAWDLAAASGQTDRLDPALAEGALPAYRAALPSSPRGGDVPFAPVVAVGAEAGAYERLVAWTGRDPSWG